jgi:hypothetical protein
MVLEGIIGSFTPEKNIWELYPNLKLLSAFKKFYNYDKSNNKERSSKEVWGFFFLYDMGSANFMRHMDEESRKQLVAETIICNVNYDWDKEKTIQEEIQKLCQPAPQRSLYETYKKLVERDEFIRNTSYTLDDYDNKGKLKKGTADQIDRMLLGTGKLYEQIEFWQKKVQMERDTRKGKNLSESDTGEI